MTESNPALHDTLRTLLQTFLTEGQQMIDNDAPISSLGLESVVVMEFVTDVEDHFDINIDLDALAHIQSLNDLAAAVTDQLAQ